MTLINLLISHNTDVHIPLESFNPDVSRVLIFLCYLFPPHIPRPPPKSMKVISAALSQLDSEEEWKLVPSGSGNSSGGKSGGPYSPLEVTEVPVMEQRVMLSGDKVSAHTFVQSILVVQSRCG